MNESYQNDTIVARDEEKTYFASGATRGNSEGKGRYDLIPPEAIEALAKRFEFGLKSGHEAGGYKKGIPDWSLFDSAMRHLNQARAGHQDEDHLAAVMWNVAVLIFNRESKRLQKVEGERDANR